MPSHPESVPANWQQQADRLVQQKKYDQAANLYEQAIELEPNIQTHYWHLGVLMVLQGQETEAQTILQSAKPSRKILQWRGRFRSIYKNSQKKTLS